MAAQTYYSPFIPAFSPNGLPVPGAFLTFYYSQTETKAPIYLDDSLATPSPNPVQADLAARFPTIYLDDDVVYRVRLTDSNGAPLGSDIDPYLPGQALKGATGPANSTYTTLADLKSAAVSNASYIFAPPGGSDGGAAAGTFLYQTAGAPYTADGLNIIKLNSVPLTVGALVRQQSSAIGFVQDGPNAAPTSLEPTAKAFAVPAQFKGTDDQQVGYLLSSGKRLIVFPEREMLLTETHIIPRGTKILAPSGAQFNAGVDNLTMFKTEAGTFGTRWEGGTLYGNNKTGVNGFDLTGFRHAAEIVGTWMQDMNVGIRLRDLCWDVALLRNFMVNMVDGIIVDRGCNAVTIDPRISGFTSTGVTINPGTDALPAVDNMLIGGYIQGGPVGLLDRARATIVNGTYFEECTQADISWSGAKFPRIISSYHSSIGGRVCLQGRNTEGGYSDGVVLQGDRTLGLFDFPADGGNAHCRARSPRSNSDNLVLGNTQTLHIEGRLGGTLEPGDVGWDGSNRVYTIQGTGPGSYISRTIANGFEDIAAGIDLSFNVLRKEGRFFSIVVGGEAFMPQGMVDGQTIVMMLKKSGTSTTPITIRGIPLDMTGVADGKRKTVRVTLNSADGNSYWIDEGAWK